MTAPFHAPPRASFLQKLGPGGAVSLLLALLTALGGALLPVVWRLRQVLRGAEADPPGPVDLILVLGRRLEGDALTEVFRARLAWAQALLERGLAPRLVIAGGLTGNATRSEAEAGRDWLVARGVPESAILLEDHSQHTLENLFNVRAHMRAEGWRHLVLVSDPLHLARARAPAPGLGRDARCSPAAGAPPARGSLGWWRRAALESFLLHWYHTGMLYSRLLGRRAQLERVT
ncbi:MAG: YdcF family protein [Holophagaceae bacterium]